MNENYTFEHADALADEMRDKRLSKGAAADLAGCTLGLDWLFCYALAAWAEAMVKEDAA